MDTGDHQSLRKRCGHCAHVKSVADYHKLKASPDGLQSWCKRCVAAYLAEYRKANRARLAAYHLQYVRAWRARRALARQQSEPGATP